MWVLDHKIKKSANCRGEKCPEPVSLGENAFILKQGPKQVRLELDRLCVNPLEHCGIEAQFIPKVAKDQRFVIAGDLRNRVDARAIKAVLREDGFSRIKNRLAG